jgi:hypothetical protein
MEASWDGDCKPLNGSGPDTFTGKRDAFNRSMQHHMRTAAFRGGVYDQREMLVETFSRSEKRRVGPLKGRAHAA